MYLRTKRAALAIAGAAASLVLAATAAPALASSQAAAQATTTPEVALGAIYGKPAAAEFPVIPLSWQGLVSSHGTFHGNGTIPKKGQEHAFSTAAGKLVVLITGAPGQSQTLNTKTCHFSATVTAAFAAVRGRSTGKFSGVTGPGAVKVYFAGYVPRFTSGSKKGLCNTSPSAPELAKGAVASFLLSAVLTKA